MKLRQLESTDSGWRFEGIASEGIKVAISTIIQMIKNLEEVEEIIR